MARAKASLDLRSVIGFAGHVPSGLLIHNDDQRLLYPLGSTMVVKNLLENTQYFLESGGSETTVSAACLSRDGKLLATGQSTHPGFPVSVFIWDLDTGKVLQKLDLHKGKIQGIVFSPSGKYIATLGGEEDNKLVIWNVETGDGICGSPVANDSSFCVKFANNDDYTLVTAGKYNFRIWKFDVENRKIRPTDCALGQIKRIVNCVTIDPNDEVIYAGTQSGDLLRISMVHSLFQKRGPVKKPFPQGIQTVALAPDGNVVIGTGNGTVALMDKESLKVLKSIELKGNVTSIVFNKSGNHFFVGTAESNIYLVALDDFDYELRSTGHNGKINDITFPSGVDDLFVTAGYGDIRVWNTQNLNELLRIQVPAITCHCVILTNDGTAIVSGWDDGKVRAFYPESGKTMWTIHDCHVGGVTALNMSKNGKKLVTGGVDGNVRIWQVESDCQNMLISLREHQNAVSYICMSEDDTQFVSASQDGSCVVWDLVSFARVNAMFASTQFSTVLYHPDQSQFLTTGTDRQLTYWDAVDCTPIRIIDGSDSGSINSISITPDGEYYATAGHDKLVKLWHYDKGLCSHVGTGHSNAIQRVVVSPNKNYIVSVGDDNAIMVWNFPKDL